MIGGLLEQRYRVGALVARGGMSTVYRGVDTRLDRPVAIKVMDPQLSADPAFVARFEGEARAAAKLHHPGVVAVHDQGVDEDRVFLVMELVEGGTLRDLLAERGTLGVPLALTVLERVLAALAAAHRADLVHRDVKPENVLIGRGGVVKVADFGLARAMSGPGITTDGTILGTVSYLSPEQVTTGAADARSDVYAAGVLLYEMLTGTPPYTGDNAVSVAYRHVNDDVPAVPDVPPQVAELVRRATRREPFLRPADAEAFLSEVEAARAELGITREDVPVPASGLEARTVRVQPVRVDPAPPAAPAATPTAVPPAPAGSTTGGTTGGATEATVRVQRPTPPVGAGPMGTMAMPRTALAPPPVEQVVPAAPPVKPRPRPKKPRKTPEQLLEEQRKRARRRLVTWGSVAAAAVLLVGMGTWWLGAGQYTTVPSLVGQDEEVALALLEDASLKNLVSLEASDTAPVGQVLRTDPAAGAEARRGDLVRLVVSRGKPVVPQIQAGIEVDAAREEIESVGLSARLDEQKDAFSDRVPKGKVVTLDPPPGSQVSVGATVTIVVSKGSQPKPVPDLTGRTKDEAFAELTSLGFEPVEGPAEFSPTVDNGRVVRTDPGVGTNLPPGQRRVTVIVSNAVTVPDVERKRVRDARKELEEAGLEVDVQFNNRDRATVFNQSIRGGTRVPEKTRVVLIAV
ncbi:serine/threonine-protein kinase [Saccharothrix coeruleofusca]|nr:Stk1 family PASTA domain-containing Ser/Thr kinase [Saccharothrix coeruleofusca]MBP2334419.1 serine/threonine-protein kinase [Saccharothrix coeruleofusca]